MSDGVGTASFSYDQISRLTSETRHFNDLAGLPGGGNYTLAYQYNLADALTSLTQPSQFSGTVNYAYDSAARLVSVTGSGFGATTQFASNMQYRAWGSIKQMNYGSGATLNLTYTPRLTPLRYELGNMKPNGGPATIMGSQNQYYADGRVKYTQDLQNGNFDRAYEYDHAGRIKEAYSGREARGLPVLPYPDNPFRQSYTYDVWNNMKRPANRHWSAGLPDNPTYTNNRRNDASYDAAGNITVRDNERKQHAYDAAGRHSYFLQEEWGLPNYAYEANTLQVTYDGDGRPAKRFDNGHTETYEEVPWDEPKNTYYVRSSVLGGAAIVEFVPDGWGTTENIYMGPQQIASHFVDSGFIQWRHVNPATGSWLVSSVTSGGALANRNELDPLNTEMGTSDPYVSYTSYQDLVGLESLYEERGNPFDPSGGCGTLDGLPISCSELRMRMQGGSVATEIEVPVSPRVEPGASPRTPYYPRHLRVFREAIIYMGAGLYGTDVPTIKGGPHGSGNNEGGWTLGWTTEVFAEPPAGVRFLRDESGNTSYGQNKEKMIFTAILALNSDECTDAFKAAGLTDPFTAVTGANGFNGGVVIGPASLATNPQNTAYMGIPEQARREVLAEFGSGNARAFTVMGRYNSDGQPRIFLNTSAFQGAGNGFRGLVTDLAHEFIHVAGVKGVKPPWYKPWQDDLSFDGKYQNIIDTCVNAADDFIRTRENGQGFIGP